MKRKFSSVIIYVTYSFPTNSLSSTPPTGTELLYHRKVLQVDVPNSLAPIGWLAGRIKLIVGEQKPATLVRLNHF